MSKNKANELSLHVITYAEIQDLTISQRVKKILNLVLGNKIVILHGRLRPEEEARLIEDTMALVDHIKDFRGIELAVINPTQSSLEGFSKFKYDVLSIVLGDRQGLTIIGPANVVKAISKDPDKIELFTTSERSIKKKRG